MRIFSISISWLVLLLIPPIPVYAGTKELAITFDDLPAALVPTHAEQLRVNQRILDILNKYQIKATGFVIGIKSFGRADILNLWLEQGHDLGNHTYSHVDFDMADVFSFQMDIIRGAFEIEKLLRDHQKRLTYFRFPYLHTGNNLEKREGIRKFLRENYYIIAPVTIDPCDWAYNNQLFKSRRAQNKEEQEQIKASYLERIKRATQEAEILSWERFGRNIKHVLLLHLNRINAEVLDKIIEYYSLSGYSFISLEEALKDSAYSSEGELIEPESLTWPVRPVSGFHKEISEKVR